MMPGLKSILAGIKPAQLSIYPELWKKAGYSKADWNRVKNLPRIIHYTGAAKPWLRDPDLLPRPGYSYFFKYISRTPYRDAFTGPRLERIIGYRAYFFLWQLMRMLYHFVVSHRAIKRN